MRYENLRPAEDRDYAPKGIPSTSYGVENRAVYGNPSRRFEAESTRINPERVAKPVDPVASYESWGEGRSKPSEKLMQKQHESKLASAVEVPPPSFDALPVVSPIAERVPAPQRVPPVEERVPAPQRVPPVEERVPAPQRTSPVPEKRDIVQESPKVNVVQESGSFDKKKESEIEAILEEDFEKEIAQELKIQDNEPVVLKSPVKDFVPDDELFDASPERVKKIQQIQSLLEKAEKIETPKQERQPVKMEKDAIGKPDIKLPEGVSRKPIITAEQLLEPFDDLLDSDASGLSEPGDVNNADSDTEIVEHIPSMKDEAQQEELKQFVSEEHQKVRRDSYTDSKDIETAPEIQEMFRSKAEDRELLGDIQMNVHLEGIDDESDTPHEESYEQMKARRLDQDYMKVSGSSPDLVALEQDSVPEVEEAESEHNYPSLDVKNDRIYTDPLKTASEPDIIHPKDEASDASIPDDLTEHLDDMLLSDHEDSPVVALEQNDGEADAPNHESNHTISVDSNEQDKIASIHKEEEELISSEDGELKSLVSDDEQAQQDPSEQVLASGSLVTSLTNEFGLNENALEHEKEQELVQTKADSEEEQETTEIMSPEDLEEQIISPAEVQDALEAQNEPLLDMSVSEEKTHQYVLPPEHPPDPPPYEPPAPSDSDDSYDLGDEEINKILEEANSGLDYSSNSDIDQVEAVPPEESDSKIRQLEKHRFGDALASVLRGHVVHPTPMIQREIASIFQLSDTLIANELASIVFPVSKE